MARSSYHTGLGCSRPLTFAILSLLISVFQLLGKARGAASCIAGMLLVLKIVVELRSHRKSPRPCAPRPRPAPLVRRTPQEALGGCSFCKELHVLRPSSFDGMRVGVCQQCHRCLRLSRWPPAW